MYLNNGAGLACASHGKLNVVEISCLIETLCALFENVGALSEIGSVFIKLITISNS